MAALTPAGSIVHDYRGMLSLRLGSQTRKYVKAEVMKSLCISSRPRCKDYHWYPVAFLILLPSAKSSNGRTRLAKHSGGSEGFAILLGLGHAYDSSPPILLDLLRDPTLTFRVFVL